MEPKRLGLLREALPGVTRVGELVYPLNPIFQLERKRKEEAYRSLRMEPIFVEVTRVSDLESAVVEVARRAGQVLVVSAEPLFADNFHTIVQVAQRLSIPILAGVAEWVYLGALMGFGPSEEEFVDSLANIVNKVLKGAKPADIPVQQPTKFELAINLKVAKALGISVPQSVLMRADGVVQ